MIKVGDVVQVYGPASRKGTVISINRRHKFAIVDWGNGEHGPHPISSLVKVAP